MLYQKLAELYKQLESTTKRLEKIKILSEFLKKLSDENKEVMYLLVGKIYPEYNEKKLEFPIKLQSKQFQKQQEQIQRELFRNGKK